MLSYGGDLIILIAWWKKDHSKAREAVVNKIDSDGNVVDEMNVFGQKKCGLAHEARDFTNFLFIVCMLLAIVQAHRLF